ncbi:MAG: hypothetical protein H7Y06_11360 [Opitutaceae bacterium]|nr:hypothetical protein [Opitutaceae bacterium]
MSTARSPRTQIALITVAAVALYAGFRALPTGTNLHQVDFNTQGKGMIELCDPSNPQFVAVTTARSPVTMTARTDAPAATGRESRLTLALATSTGKPVGDRNLLVQHTRKLHLLVVDPTLRDYQHLHPEPSEIEGEWTVAFTPRLAGTYRVFADLVPVPTGRSLYTGADLPVAGEVVSTPVAFSWDAEVDGYLFKLTPASPIRAGKPADLVFTVLAPHNGPVPLEPVMDAYAHLVAFDQANSGFAHLHPVEAALTPFADPTKPSLNFKITIPDAGIYVIWAQVKLAGREVFAPFWFEVGQP